MITSTQTGQSSLAEIGLHVDRIDGTGYAIVATERVGSDELELGTLLPDGSLYEGGGDAVAIDDELDSLSPSPVDVVYVQADLLAEAMLRYVAPLPFMFGDTERSWI